MVGGFMYISYRTRYATSMHQSFPRPRPPLEDTRSRLLLGDTRGKPTVFTLFLFDLGFPLVGKYTFFHGLAVQCGGLSVSLFRLFPVSHFPAFYEQFKFWRRSSDLKKGSGRQLRRLGWGIQYFDWPTPVFTRFTRENHEYTEYILL